MQWVGIMSMVIVVEKKPAIYHLPSPFGQLEASLPNVFASSASLPAERVRVLYDESVMTEGPTLEGRRHWYAVMPPRPLAYIVTLEVRVPMGASGEELRQLARDCELLVKVASTDADLQELAR